MRLFTSSYWEIHRELWYVASVNLKNQWRKQQIQYEEDLCLSLIITYTLYRRNRLLEVHPRNLITKVISQKCFAKKRCHENLELYVKWTLSPRFYFIMKFVKLFITFIPGKSFCICFCHCFQVDQLFKVSTTNRTTITWGFTRITIADCDGEFTHKSELKRLTRVLENSKTKDKKQKKQKTSNILEMSGH